MATVTASTKRAPAISDGKRGEAVTNIASLKCFPLDPVDPEIRQRLGLNTPHEILQTFTQSNLDIKVGDVLVVSTREYPIKAVSDWSFGVGDYLHLILEDLK
jgi:hypothetical protein